MDDIAALTADLERIAMAGGADLFGVADLTTAREFIHRQGGALVSAYPRAISIALRLSPAMVEQVADQESVAALRNYRFYVYQAVNPALDRVSVMLTRRLVEAGYRAYMVPASDSLDTGKLWGLFSHKLAANLAGIGFIGKSCLLVAPRYGGRVRLGTVLTDAPLAPGNSLSDAEKARVREGCGDCSRCVDACPPHAFTGVAFRPEDPREVRFKAHLCDRYMAHHEKTLGARACGMCVLACNGIPDGQTARM